MVVDVNSSGRVFKKVDFFEFLQDFDQPRALALLTRQSVQLYGGYYDHIRVSAGILNR